MNRILVIAATIGSAAAAAAVAQPAATAPEAPATEAKEKTICRYISEVGSRLSRRRICATKAQWDEVDAQNRLAVDRVQNGRQTQGN